MIRDYMPAPAVPADGPVNTVDMALAGPRVRASVWHHASRRHTRGYGGRRQREVGGRRSPARRESRGMPCVQKGGR